jgi:large subunit ribosomal protein L2
VVVKVKHQVVIPFRTGKYAKGEKTRTRGKGSDKLIIQRKNGKKLAK